MALFNFFSKKNKETVLEPEQPIKVQQEPEQTMVKPDTGPEAELNSEPHIEPEAELKAEPYTMSTAELKTEPHTGLATELKTEAETGQEIKPKTELEDGQGIETEITEPIASEGFFKKIFSGLDKTRRNIMSGVDNVLRNFVKIDEEVFEELEEVLIMADIGVETSTAIIESLKGRVKSERVTDADGVKRILIDEITKILETDAEPLNLHFPAVILVIGVNGVGKTTTIGKLAYNFKAEGKKVLVAAADTFRAAAIDQLEIWCSRSKVDIIKHQENSDPAAVVYDAVQAARARKADILICDTAGRLHNKKNLMEELKKIFRIINQNYPEAHQEVLLVLDATTGQNALQQAKIFKEAASITGIVLTKLDGTAKGGIVIAIKNELKIPIKYIGVGEGVNDLQEFNATDFAKALFNERVSI